jgi:hypothetical protein
VAALLPLPNTEVDFLCLALDAKSVEKIKDRVKSALWPAVTKEISTEELAWTTPARTKAFLSLMAAPNRERIISAVRPLKKSRRFDIHCVFWSPRGPSEKEIVTHSFDHGGGHFYRYRLHRSKAGWHHAFGTGMRDFLFRLRSDCPNHFFEIGPRISAVAWEMYPEATWDADCDLPELARAALREARYKGAHESVEVYCLGRDSSTSAVEVPVWLEREEMGPFRPCFPSTGPLTGHVDILRINSESIEVWDYKPDVALADKAGMQVFIYALVLSVRTEIPLDHFRCGFFDANSAWSFNPNAVAFSPLRRFCSVAHP